MPPFDLRFDHPPFRLSGAVYAALLNHAPQLASLGDAVHRPPYKAPPQAPVLAVQPRNSLALNGATVALPSDAPAVQLGASLGIVIGRVACRVPAAQALQWVAGYTLVNDLCLPHASHYRPAVRLQARDGFCVIGPGVLPASAIAHPDALAVQIEIDGHLAQATDTAGRLRGVAQLIADVSDFMTLQPGDLLLLGASAAAPLARPGRQTRRPAGVAFMHCECELAVVTGKTARGVKAADAMAHVAGYTVCNDRHARGHGQRGRR